MTIIVNFIQLESSNQLEPFGIEQDLQTVVVTGPRDDAIKVIAKCILELLRRRRQDFTQGNDVEVGKFCQLFGNRSGITPLGFNVPG